jgi:hypothetical protein
MRAGSWAEYYRLLAESPQPECDPLPPENDGPDPGCEAATGRPWDEVVYNANRVKLRRNGS